MTIARSMRRALAPVRRTSGEVNLCSFERLKPKAPLPEGRSERARLGAVPGRLGHSVLEFAGRYRVTGTSARLALRSDCRRVFGEDYIQLRCSLGSTVPFRNSG